MVHLAERGCLATHVQFGANLGRLTKSSTLCSSALGQGSFSPPLLWTVFVGLVSSASFRLMRAIEDCETELGAFAPRRSGRFVRAFRPRNARAYVGTIHANRKGTHRPRPVCGRIIKRRSVHNASLTRGSIPRSLIGSAIMRGEWPSVATRAFFALRLLAAAGVGDGLGGAGLGVGGGRIVWGGKGGVCG